MGIEPQQRSIEASIFTRDCLTLVDRLARAMPVNRRDNGNESTERVRLILSYCIRVLNSKAGCSAASPAFGLRDPRKCLIGTRAALNDACSEIRRTLIAYEPRIEWIDVVSNLPSDRIAFLCFGLHFGVKSDQLAVSADLALTCDCEFKLLGVPSIA